MFPVRYYAKYDKKKKKNLCTDVYTKWENEKIFFFLFINFTKNSKF